MSSQGIVRQCISCKEKFLRANLIRILQDHKTGELIANPDNTNHGRSIYVCKTKDCLEELKTNKRYKGKTQYQEVFKNLKYD